MTFEEKLEKFKNERVGFRVSSKEIADELVRVFTGEHLESRRAWGVWADIIRTAWHYAKEDSYVTGVFPTRHQSQPSGRGCCRIKKW